MDKENINVEIDAKDEPPLIEVKASVNPKSVPSSEILRSYIERIERLEEEKHEISQDINDVYSEAKNSGFDTKVMRQIIRLRKMSPADRAETNYLLEEYKRLLGLDE